MWGPIYGLVLQHVVLPAGQEEECVDRPLLLCEPFIHTYLTVWSEPGKLFVQSLRISPTADMSVNRCVCFVSRLQRHFNSRTARITTSSCHVSSGSSLLQGQHRPGTVVWSRDVSSNSSSPKPPDTSLFVPVSLKADTSADGGVGIELTQPLDKSE